MGLLNGKKDYDYFDSFCQVGQIASQSANYLKQVVEAFHYQDVSTYVDDMHVLENSADAKRHELCNHLAKEFMPPIEREDISLLSQELDNIVDSVEEVIRKIYMFNIQEVRFEIIEFTKLVANCCDVFHKLLCEFPNFKKSKTIHNYIVEINTLENKGDKLYADSIHRLFCEKVDTLNALSWTVIFDALENSLDACENAADIIDDIITKNT